MNNLEEILVVGPGIIGMEYYKILQELNYIPIVIGRGIDSAKNFEEKFEIKVHSGGISKWLETNPKIPKNAIVAVTGVNLGQVCIKLMEKGVKNILLEKPGGTNFDEILKVAEIAKQYGSNVLLAYNRRFYSSVIKAKELIQKDRGVKSFHFEFTEWSHVIKDLNKPKLIKENWFFHNSTHVIDMAFYLCGEPVKMSSYKGGKLSWHPSGSIFVGSGITTNNALFSYHSNWTSPGRWNLEILTENYRFIFKPLEELKYQEIGSVKIQNFEIDRTLDIEYKPGFYLQVKNFLNQNWKDFLTIHDQAKRLKLYKKILNLDNDDIK
jgi:predicted dehydrogenase